MILSLSLLFLSIFFSGCGAAGGPGESAQASATADAVSAVSWNDLSADGEMDLKYADQFSVKYYKEGGSFAESGEESGSAKEKDDYALATLQQEGDFLVVPEGKDVPSDIPDGTTVIRLPLSNVFVASSSTMDFWRQLDALPVVKMCATQESGWSIPEIQKRMEDGDILYAGKYNAPDDEMLVDQDCDFIIENTMIYHAPDTLEKLEDLGFPVLVDRSSYESHPMGRLEWVKLYGLFSGKGQEAEEFFDSQDKTFTQIASGNASEENSGRTVAFFYVTSNGSVNVRKAGDYISKMINLSGGQYVFQDLGDEDDNALSTVNMQMETFYNDAKDADILIYNSTVEQPLSSMDDLLEKSSLFSDFKAVQEDNVFCTTQDMYQQPTGICQTMEDFNAIIQDPSVSDDELHYLYRVK